MKMQNTGTFETSVWRDVEGVCTARPELVPANLKSWERWYTAPRLLKNGHLMTIYASKARASPTVNYERVEVLTTDGGVLAMDLLRPPSSTPVKKLLVLLSGLGGGSHDSYVKHMALAAQKRGYAIAAVNMRACGGRRIETPRFFSAYRGSVDDLAAAVDKAREMFQPEKVAAIGWSNSGSILINSCAQEEPNALVNIDAACALAAPLNMPASSSWLKQSWFHSRVYDYSIGTNLATKFKEASHLFQMPDGSPKPVKKWEPIGGYYVADVQLAENAKSIREIDEAITAPCFGFDSVDDYYAFSSPDNRIADTKLPLFILNAADDPIARWGPNHHPDSIFLRRLKSVASSNPNLVFAVTRHGGHLGWCPGHPYATTDASHWVQDTALDFLDKALHLG